MQHEYGRLKANKKALQVQGFLGVQGKGSAINACVSSAKSAGIAVIFGGIRARAACHCHTLAGFPLLGRLGFFLAFFGKFEGKQLRLFLILHFGSFR
jgi:hypothetical protein